MAAILSRPKCVPVWPRDLWWVVRSCSEWPPLGSPVVESSAQAEPWTYNPSARNPVWRPVFWYHRTGTGHWNNGNDIGENSSHSDCRIDEEINHLTVVSYLQMKRVAFHYQDRLPIGTIKIPIITSNLYNGNSHIYIYMLVISMEYMFSRKYSAFMTAF